MGDQNEYYVITSAVADIMVRGLHEITNVIVILRLEIMSNYRWFSHKYFQIMLLFLSRLLIIYIIPLSELAMAWRRVAKCTLIFSRSSTFENYTTIDTLVT